MDKMTKKIIGAFGVIIVAAAVVLGIYFVMNREAEKKAQEEILPSTEVGKLLAKDLDLKYPETPTEVLKLYWRYNRCMYNEGMSDSDFKALLKQLRKLYDDELLSEEGNSFEDMLSKFQEEKKANASAEQTISACVVQENDTVVKKDMDGRKCAFVITSSLIKADGEMTKTYEKFLCRRDKEGNWKILGWQQTTADEAAKVDVE